MYFFFVCSNTLNSLVDESGCHLEHPKAATFRAHVIAGEWDQVKIKERGVGDGGGSHGKGKL